MQWQLIGRKTYKSIGRALPGRENIIISRNNAYQQADCEVFNTTDKAIATCQKYNEIFVIGGATLYESMLAVADRLYLTEIHKHLDGDAFFPEINKSEWLEIEREDISTDPSVGFSYSFVRLERYK